MPPRPSSIDLSSSLRVLIPARSSPQFRSALGSQGWFHPGQAPECSRQYRGAQSRTRRRPSPARRYGRLNIAVDRAVRVREVKSAGHSKEGVVDLHLSANLSVQPPQNGGASIASSPCRPLCITAISGFQHKPYITLPVAPFYIITNNLH